VGEILKRVQDDRSKKFQIFLFSFQQMNFKAKGGPMKTDRLTKILLGIIAILLCINLLNSLLSSKPALAVPGSEDTGRYQIAAWGVQAQNSDPRSGYYVLDTVTGKVVAGKSEIYR
jgi:hypothetical protein